eukprot:PhM_4_TR15824/c0_g1_i1/m.57652
MSTSSSLLIVVAVAVMSAICVVSAAAPHSMLSRAQQEKFASWCLDGDQDHLFPSSDTNEVGLSADGVVTARLEDGDTCMIIAAGSGQLALVKRLIKVAGDHQGDAIRAKNKQGTNAFFAAVSRGHLPVVKLLADVDATLLDDDAPEPGWSSPGRDSSSPVDDKERASLAFAPVESGNIDIVKYLLTQRPNMLHRRKASDGASLLFVAAQHGRLGLARRHRSF